MSHGLDYTDTHRMMVPQDTERLRKWCRTIVVVRRSQGILYLRREIQGLAKCTDK